VTGCHSTGIIFTGPLLPVLRCPFEGSLRVLSGPLTRTRTLPLQVVNENQASVVSGEAWRLMMMERLRQFFRTPAGMAVAGVLVAIGLVIAIGTIRGVMVSEAESIAGTRMYVDSATGKPFRVKLKIGMTAPVEAPSGGKTGFPAESCYWTKEGKPKKEATYLLLNMVKGSKEPTFCPDCGRLVVPHNPVADEGLTPPPTKEEYEKSGRRSGSGR
jgi:hypothetical protein